MGLRENQALWGSKGKSRSRASKVAHLPCGCQDILRASFQTPVSAMASPPPPPTSLGARPTAQPVHGGSPPLRRVTSTPYCAPGTTRAWILSLPRNVTAIILTIKAAEGGGGAGGDRPLRIHSFVLSPLATDHTTKAEAEAEADDRKALPALRAQTITPGAHPYTSACLTTPHPMAQLRAQGPLAPSGL